MKMGNRISISFSNKDYGESVVLFSHWDGMDFLESALKYIEDLKNNIDNNGYTPLDRLEPNTIMLDFIVKTLGDKVEANYYLGKNENDGDNSDNGHFKIDVDEPAIKNALRT